MANRGATLVSFLVAAALSGVIGLTVMRLAAHQGEALLIVSLVDERERLLKHYANTLINGWDKTRSMTSPPYTNRSLRVYDRAGNVVIKPTGEEVGDHNEWTVKAIANDIVSDPNVVMGDHHTGGTVKSVKVRIVVSFDPAKHPNTDASIADREEWVYLQNSHITPAQNTDCSSNQHPSQKTDR